MAEISAAKKAEWVAKLKEFVQTRYAAELVAAANSHKSLPIDCTLLEMRHPELTALLRQEPAAMFAIAEEAMKGVDLVDVEGNPVVVRLRFSALPELTSVRDLRARHLGQFISTEGVVRRASEIRPEIKARTWQCPECEAKIMVESVGTFAPKPFACEGNGIEPCGNRKSFKEIEKIMVDTRMITIEEPFELAEGDRPSQVAVALREDLVDTEGRRITEAGSRLRITGVLKEVPKDKFSSTKLDFFVEANYAHPTEVGWERVAISPEDEAMIRHLAAQPDIYEQLIASMAPSLYGLQDVKESIIMQLFGGVPRTLKDKTRFRGDIHILLLGDPASGKSQLLKLVPNIVPRGKYVSGKGATTVGLTASVTKDEQFMGGWVLEAGALVLANKGLLSIDEFEKMTPEDQVGMHEAMEQQSYHKNTRVLLSNGREVEIGSLVDGLLQKNSDKVTKGKDCEILQLENEDLNILTTDFGRVYETRATQVSRHKAPRELVKITFANGRTILVTPEHPMWTLDGLSPKTVTASRLSAGSYVPIPRILPIHGIDQAIPTGGGRFPVHNGSELSRFAGYLLTDGGYELNRGKKNGVNFANKDEALIHDFCGISKGLFGLTPYVYRKEGRVTMARLISMPLVNYLRALDATFLERSEEKCIPELFMRTTNENVTQMLRAMFEGDGYASKNRIGLVSPNKTMCEQAQTLLLRFGILSQVFTETLPSGKPFYRLTVTGIENLRTFKERIGFLSRRKNAMLERQLQGSYRTLKDIIPSIGSEVSRISKALKLFESSVLDYTITCFKDGKSEFSRRGAQRFVIAFERKIERIEAGKKELVVAKSVPALKRIRIRLGIAQDDIAKAIGLAHQHISYWEKTGSNPDRYRAGLLRFMDQMLSSKEPVKKLRRLAFGDIAWARVTHMERIPYEDEWVYDIGVSPTKTFISEGLVLHNSVSIAKASIVATLPAQTSILAGGNPKYSRFDPLRSIADQITIPDTLMSRFDLKFILKDEPRTDRDTKIVDHVLQSREEDDTLSIPKIPVEIVRKYIAYAKNHCTPRLTKETGKQLKDFYLQMRKKAESGGPVPITLRQFEALMRLAEASARIQLRDVVSKDDADRAIRLMYASLRELGYDPHTRTIDIDRAEGGTGFTERNRLQKMMDLINALSQKKKDIPERELLELAEQEGIAGAEEIVDKLKREGTIFSPNVGFIRKV